MWAFGFLSQIAVHVIGDAAVDHLLSVVEIMNATNGPRDRRFRVSVFVDLRGSC